MDDSFASGPSPGSPDEPALGESVTRLEYQGRELYLVGTAHVSKRSVEEVHQTIAQLRPDAVCVELDQSRYDTLVDESRFRQLDALAVLREDRAGQMLASLLFSAFQKRLGDRLGVRPGAEMLAGVEAARAVGAEVVLADRDIQATLRRCYASLGTLDRAKIVVALSLLPFASAQVDEVEVERLKEREAISDAMSTFAEQMPALKVPLIDERDQYLMASTRSAPGKRVVSVVGAAHVAGMMQYLDRDVDRAALCVLPPRTRHAGPWLFPLLLVLVVAVAFGRGASPEAVTLLVGRALGSAGLLGALFVIVAGGGLVAVLSSLGLAPVALVLPLLPLGRLVGSAQAWARRPTPEDAVAVRADMLSPARLRKNPFLAVLLVSVAVRFGCAAGGAIGLVWAVVRLLRGV